MGFRDLSVAPIQKRQDGTRGVDRSRRVPAVEGDHSLPADTDNDPWDLDPNQDGDLVLPDDLTGRESTELLDVGGADIISFVIESVGDGDIDNPTNTQNLSFQLEWFADAAGTNKLGIDDKDDDALFGPDTKLRIDVSTVSDFVRITITSEVAAGTTNRVVASINAH